MTHRRDRTAGAMALLLALSILATACSRPPVAADVVPARDNTPTHDNGPEMVSLVVRNWVAGCSAGDDLWKWRESTTVWCDELGRPLHGHEGALDWRVYLDAEEADDLVVEGRDLDQVEMHLWWAAPEEDFVAERSAAASAERSDAREIRFALAALPEWHGELRLFRLTWKGEPTTTRVTGARVVKRFDRQERPAAATGF